MYLTQQQNSEARCARYCTGNIRRDKQLMAATYEFVTPLTRPFAYLKHITLPDVALKHGPCCSDNKWGSFRGTAAQT
jgi:hypothetical protein